MFDILAEKLSGLLLIITLLHIARLIRGDFGICQFIDPTIIIRQKSLKIENILLFVFVANVITGSFAQCKRRQCVRIIKKKIIGCCFSLSRCLQGLFHILRKVPECIQRV